MKRSYTFSFMILVALTCPAQSSTFQVKGGRDPGPTPAPARAPRRPQPDKGARIRPKPATPRFVNVTIVSITPSADAPSGTTVLPHCAVSLDDTTLEQLTDEQGRLVIPMEPGKHYVTVSKYGYVTPEPVEVVASSVNQEVRFTLTRELRSLKVRTSPGGVKVTLDGSREAESDAEGWLTFKKVDPSVPHKLRGSKEEFHDATVDVAPYQAEAQLPPLIRQLRTLKVKTNPPQAKVYLDDDLKGTSNAEGELDIAKVETERKHELRAAKEGHVTQACTVLPNYELAVIKLPPASDASSPSAGQSLDQRSDTKAEEVCGLSRADISRGVVTRQGSGLAATQDAEPTPTPAPTPTTTPTPNTTHTPAPAPAPAVDGGEVNRLIKEGRLARAIDAYAVLANSEPQNPSLSGYLDELLRSLHERTSAALSRVEPYGLTVSVEEARELSELYERVRKWRPGDQKLQALAEYWTAKYWQASAQTIPSQGGKEVYLKKARAAAQDAGAFNPRDAQVLFDLGSLYVTLGDTDEALRYFNEARTLDPAWAYPPFALATIDMKAAEMAVAKAAKATHYEQAVANLTQAITLNPAFLQAYEIRCLAYAVVNRHREAIASGQQAVALKPTSAYAHYALGFAYYQLGANKDKKEYHNAINEFNLALTLTDDALDPKTLESVRQKLAVMKKALGIKPGR